MPARKRFGRQAFVSYLEFRPSCFIRDFEFRPSNLRRERAALDLRLVRTPLSAYKSFPIRRVKMPIIKQQCGFLNIKQ